ncbi:GNAT family N-acetyltransferase [Thalassotalea ganghwensis]
MEYRLLALEEMTELHWRQCLINYYEHSLPWLKATAEFVIKRPCYIHSLWNNDTLVAAIPFYQASSRFGITTMKNLMSFYSTQAPLVENPDYIGSGKILLKTVLQSNYWHMFEFGPSFSVYDDLGYLWAERAVQVNWHCGNIESSQQYFAERPSQLRNTLKRKSRQLEKLAHQYHIADVNNFERLFADYISIYQQSWKGQEYSVEFIKSVCEQALSDGKLCLGILYIEEEPVAAQIWFIQNQCASIFKLAYVPKFSKLSVGSLLSAYISEYVIEHYKVNEIDFGMGNEPYKKDWMTSLRQRYTVLYFNQKSLLGGLCWLRYAFAPKIKSTFIDWLGKKK